jgi:hypothetical protein
MTDVFGNLLRRARGETGLTPAVPSRFEPVEPAAEVWGEVEDFVPARDRSRRAIDRPAGPGDGLAAHTSPPSPRPTPPPLGRPPETPIHLTPGAPADAEDRTDAVAPRSLLPPSVDIAAIVADALRGRDRSLTEPRAPIVTATDDSGEPPDRIEPETSVEPAVAAPTALARPAPGPAAPEPSPPAVPAIEVRIGRIEVTAPPTVSRPAPAPAAHRTRAVSLSLRDYLARRARR